MDLDDFKKVNDTYGHKTGDQLLIEIADRLREVVRRENDTIARIGGDEFFILLTGISHESQIETVIDHLFESFAEPLPVGESSLKLKVNLSVGVAVYPLHGMDPDALIRNADSAMYRAKKIDKNRFCFYDPERMSCEKDNRKKARSS
jgi:diguanylate cyclase (GGDEF)-like protein